MTQVLSNIKKAHFIYCFFFLTQKTVEAETKSPSVFVKFEKMQSLINQNIRRQAEIPIQYSLGVPKPQLNWNVRLQRKSIVRLPATFATRQIRRAFESCDSLIV